VLKRLRANQLAYTVLQTPGVLDWHPACPHWPADRQSLAWALMQVIGC
jgi:hypothetical protein